MEQLDRPRSTRLSIALSIGDSLAQHAYPASPSHPILFEANGARRIVGLADRAGTPVARSAKKSSEAFEAASVLREIEAALDPRGLSVTARGVLAKIR